MRNSIRKKTRQVKWPAVIDHFRYIKIQLDSETNKKKKMFIQFPLFVSSKPRCEAEF